MTLLYVMDEYPSVSQTFVANEAAAVATLGRRVVGYALKPGVAVKSAAAVELICPPPTRRQLLMSACRSGPRIGAALWQARRYGLTRREAARLALAVAHAAHAVPAAKAAGVSQVHAHFLGRSADVASIVAAGLGCIWTATAHGVDIYAPSEPGLLRRRLEMIAAVACANRGVQDGVDQRAAPRQVKTAMVHCGVDTRTLRFDASVVRPSPPHLVTVGRLVATKGYWTVLGAAASLMQRDATLCWTIVGDGPLRDAMARDPRYTEWFPRLRMVGAVGHEAVLALLKGTSVFVLPCEVDTQGDSDGIPVALMEAMALGVPVVTTSVAGIPELVVAGETGFVVPPGDARGLSDVLSRILYETPASQLGCVRRAARERVERDFDLVTEAHALLELWGALGADGGASGATRPGGDGPGRGPRPGGDPG